MVESSDVSIVVDAQDCPPLPGLYGIVKWLRRRRAEGRVGPLSGPTCSLGGPPRTRYFGPTLEAVFHLLAVR